MALADNELFLSDAKSPTHRQCQQQVCFTDQLTASSQSMVKFTSQPFPQLWNTTHYFKNTQITASSWHARQWLLSSFISVL